MVSQEQAVLSSGIVTILVGYVLWSLIQAGTFLPYDVGGNPLFGNIIAFLALISLFITGVGTILAAIVSNLYFMIRKSEWRIESTTLGILSVLLFLHSSILLALHAFHLFPWWGSLLSYTVFWGIVMYGKLKDKNKLKKYLATSDRARETKKTIEIRGQ